MNLSLSNMTNQESRWFRILSAIQALLLIVAASAKLWMVLTDPFADLRTDFSIPVLWVILLAEYGTGLYLVFCKHVPLRWLVFTGTLLLFLVYLIYRFWSGESSCHCFGTVELPWWLTPVYNSTMLLLLFLIRDDAGQLISIGTVRWIRSSKRAACQQHLKVLASLLGVSVAAGFFVSHKPLAFMQSGSEKLISGQDIDFGSRPLQALKIPVQLTNVSGYPVQIVGGAPSCSCMTLESLTSVLPPHSDVSLAMTISPNNPGKFHQRAIYYLDSTRQYCVTVSVTGSFEENEDEEFRY